MTALSDGLTVGVDLGGTKIAAGAVDPAGQIVCAAHLPTPRDPELILGAVIDAVRQIRNGRADVRAIGIGAAGSVDEHRSTVHFGPNLSWRDRPARALVEEATRLRVVVENDANAAAWGEFVHGAGAGYQGDRPVQVGDRLEPPRQRAAVTPARPRPAEQQADAGRAAALTEEHPAARVDHAVDPRAAGAIGHRAAAARVAASLTPSAPQVPFAWTIRLSWKLWATPVTKIVHTSHNIHGNFRIMELMSED